MKKHSSQPYNPEIANAFFRAGEIEAWGRGIERILSACLEDDIQMPEWNFDGSGLWVTFLFKNDQKNDQKNVQKELTERQKDILSLLSSDGTLTIEVMSKRLGISEKTIYRELSLLKANGLIERKGSKTKGEWVVKRNIL